ncbi:MAG: cellulase family glycosylhydrolase [Chitinispirillales bacterium]|jgi:endoglucanase|nr:cellulase family glycosylhydrolase [Chitinispirillales bacterium]
MKKRLLFVAALAVSLFAGAAWAQMPPVGWAPEGSPVAQHGRLRVTGTNIQSTVTNQNVQLRGMSLGWSSDSEHGSQYYQPRVVAWLAQDWRASVVRAAMGVSDNKSPHNGPCQVPGIPFCGTGASRSHHIDAVNRVVEAAIWQGIYVIIDWHSHHAHSAPEPEQAITFFREMAQRYKDYPNVIYEIYNEPLDVSWNTLKTHSMRIIDTIRNHDPHNLIVAPTAYFAQRLTQAANDPITGRSNILYTVHFYCNHNDTEAHGHVPFTDNVSKIPLFATEIGISRADGNNFCSPDHNAFTTWLNKLDQNNVSWAAWQITTLNENAAALRPTNNSAEISRLARGGWAENDLSASGVFYRNRLRGANPGANRGYRSNITAEPAGSGTITGTGNHVFCAPDVTFTANPSTGFRHEGWIINGASHGAVPHTIAEFCNDRMGVAVFFPNNLLTNSTFTAATAPWARAIAFPSNTTMDQPNIFANGAQREGRINVTRADARTGGWLFHPGLTIQNGATYRLSFKARTAPGSAPRTITPAIRGGTGTGGTTHVMNIADAVQLQASAAMPAAPFEFEFTATGAGTNLAFYCGDAVGEWFIDDVSLTLTSTSSVLAPAIISAPFRAALNGNALTLTGAAGKHAEVTVYDLTGRVRLSESIRLSGHNAVSLSRLPAGVYTVQYRVDGVVQPQRERIMLAR